MTDYSDHVRFLIFVLIPLLIIFILGFVFDQQDLWFAAMAAIFIIVGVISLLARWGGGLPPTD